MRPPGPRGLPVVGSLLDVYRDPLAFVTRMRDRYGDIARVDIAGLPFYQLNAPADIDTVLRVRHTAFTKGRLGADKRRLFGDGLATSEGELWRRQRRLAQPAFHRERIAEYAATVTRFAGEAVDALADGRAIDLHGELMRLTLRVVAKLLFDADVTRDAGTVGAALGELMTYFTRQSSFFLRLAPRAVRRFARRGFDRAVDRLDRVIGEIIERRRGDQLEHRDLLGMWMAARDDDGSAMSDRQLRDEVMTAFLAGHETTALALSWTFGLLARHPEIEAEVVAEVDRVGPDASRLPTLAAVLKEAMRLYPPAWILVRQAQQPIELAGVTVPARSFVVMSPWSVHRDPRLYRDPQRFWPARWHADLEASLPRCAYFPFGSGPRGCIGHGLATMEATLVLATVLARARFVARDPQLDPEASISLRPRGGLHGRLVPRTRAAAARSAS